MPQTEPRKIAYLFGAGATHSELINLYQEVPEKLGLLTSNVSDRVIKRAKRAARYLKGVEMVTPESGSLNIELLISLIEGSKIHGWEYKTRYIKKLVKQDIKGILTASRTTRFHLHKALIEFHEHQVTKTNESLIGLISLNYDDVLDQAYKEYYKQPNYCFTLESGAPVSAKKPLLKLHGSFNWTGIKIRGRRKTIEIIPLGASKNYLHAPYGFIWNRALEILIECDTLRVIGCSLSPNDAHLIDLIFKAHLERPKALEIEIIDFDQAGEDTQKRYRFFPSIKRLTQIEKGLIPEPRTSGNPFKTWLKYKSSRMLRGQLQGTKYLKIVCK
ncbi:MAG: SIR2 family protein [Candidatus Acidiferrales bacterium]